MDCSQAKGLMCSAALGALAEVEGAEFNRHLADCASCREEHRRALAALRLAAEVPEAEPAGLNGRILSAARAELGASRRRRRALAWVGSLAGAAAAALVAWGLYGLLAPKPAPSCGCWRFVLGDPGNCRRAEAGATGLPDHVVWQKSLVASGPTFKPLAWKETIIVGAEPVRATLRKSERLVAFSAADGAISWEREIPQSDSHRLKGFPDRCIQGGRLYVTDGQGCLVLDPATGRELARLVPPPEAKGWGYLTASGARLYGAAADGRVVFCLEAADGRAVWSRPVEGATFVPALSGGKLYVATDSGAVSALDAATGREIWKRPGAAPTGRASVHAGGGVVLLLSEGDRLLAFNASDGAPAWDKTVPGAFASGLALGDRSVYLLGGNTALALASGTPVWEASGASGSPCAAPTVAGGEILASGSGAGGNLNVLDGAGQPLGGLAGASLSSCDGAIVLHGRIFTVGGGRLVAVACRPRG